jgi:putative oxidoreductase
MGNLAQNFDLTNGLNILRIACALFFIPHLFVKFMNQEGVKPIYAKGGFNPPTRWLYASFVVEIIATIGLFFGIYTPYVATFAGIFLLAAAWCSYRASGGKWIWSFGGAEFPVFWAIACFVVAMMTWRTI